jgi:cell division protein FtsL
MEIDKQYFIKSIISLLVLTLIFFLYLHVNIKKSKLNEELSVNTNNYIELKEDISTLEIEYNRLIRTEILEKKASKNFEMKMPESSDIIRVKDE